VNPGLRQESYLRGGVRCYSLLDRGRMLRPRRRGRAQIGEVKGGTKQAAPGATHRDQALHPGCATTVRRRQSFLFFAFLCTAHFSIVADGAS